ncbi:MAG: TonB-dependent receptor domain-containing protein, partial [Paludibacter sp.]
FLKLRASWGQVGNQSIDAWKYLPQIKTNNTYYYYGNGINTGNLSAVGASVNVAGSYPTIGNASLIWETSEQTNVGVDAKFLHSRLSANLDLYNKISKGWLIEAPIRVEAGAETSLMNGGDVTNRGVELALTWNDKIGTDFNYNISGNVAYNNNTVGNVPTADGIIYGNSNEAYNNAAAVYRKAQTGYPIGYFWGYKTDGILQNQADVNSYVATLKNGSPGNSLQGRNIAPGDVKFVDVNGDGLINENDKTMIGSPSPDFTFGLSLGFSWKAFDFSLTSNGVAGNEIFQSYRDYGSKTANYTTAILNRWHGEGTSNLLPRVTETNINYQISDIFIHKGDFLRISNIQIGYDFAKNIKWKYLSQCRLYVAVQNAFTITTYDGMDPEVGYGTADTGNTGSSVSSTSGIDLGYYPRPRTILTGISVKF